MRSVTATATGASAALTLPIGEWALEFTSEGAFTLDLQAGIETDFFDVYDSNNNKITIVSTSGPRHVIVDGEISYRMDVDSYASAITMKAIKVK